MQKEQVTLRVNHQNVWQAKVYDIIQEYMEETAEMAEYEGMSLEELLEDIEIYIEEILKNE